MPALPPVDRDAELGELKEYLGDDFDERALERYQETVNEELSRAASEDDFYRTSRAYLYNLTVFAISGTKDPYLEELMRHVPPGARLLDYGCGIGSDGLRLIEAGYRISFADFSNPSTEYLRWRLRRRGLDAEVFDLDRDQPSGFDLAYAFDVIEHVEDPIGMLARMERTADRVLVNCLEDDEDEDEPMHRSLPFGRVLRRATVHGLLSYQTWWGRSHVVLYWSRAPRLRDRLRSPRVLAGGWRKGDVPAILLPLPWDWRPWRTLRQSWQRVRN